MEINRRLIRGVEKITASHQNPPHSPRTICGGEGAVRGEGLIRTQYRLLFYTADQHKQQNNNPAHGQYNKAFCHRNAKQ